MGGCFTSRKGKLTNSCVFLMCIGLKRELNYFLFGSANAIGSTPIEALHTLESAKMLHWRCSGNALSKVVLCLIRRPS